MSDQPETSREAFERWAEANGYPLLQKRTSGYSFADTNAAWKAWQAAAYWVDTGELPREDS